MCCRCVSVSVCPSAPSFVCPSQAGRPCCVETTGRIELISGTETSARLSYAASTVMLQLHHLELSTVKSAYNNIDQRLTRMKVGLTEKKLKVKIRKNSTD